MNLQKKIEKVRICYPKSNDEREIAVFDIISNSAFLYPHVPGTVVKSILTPWFLPQSYLSMRTKNEK
jgi:hypothetical protein